MAFLPRGGWLFFCFLLLKGQFAAANLGTIKQKTFAVKEEQPAGTEVGSLNDDDDSSKFKFLDSITEFRLDEKTGILTTNKVFDRETLSKDVLLSGFNFVIESSSTTSSYIIEVVVFIHDLNDNKPMFTVPSFVANVREDIVSGHAIEIPNAQDLDDDPNAEVVYDIVSGDIFHTFKIEPRLNKNGETYCLVRTTSGELDADTQPNQLNLNISACDKLLPRQCSYLKVTLKIEDVNDNPPIMNPELPDLINIYENATKDKPIFHVHATDKDQGTNGEVIYEIVDNGIKEFAINPNTGEIYVMAKNLDAETRDYFVLVIVAQDKASQPKKDTLHLHVKVLDCNDERPLLKIHADMIDGDLFNIAEGSPVGMTVGTISITDNDSSDDNNQIIRVELTRGNDYFALKKDYSVKTIGGKKTWIYTIYITKLIDREQTPTILLSAEATDNGRPSLTGTVNYTMTIDDINDNPPVFSETYYEAKVNESESVGKRILRVSATDKDFAQNADISYSIIGKSGRQAFHIDEDTGEITLSDNVDRELYEYITLNISARDHGIPTLTNHALVNITILDANDNHPAFVNSTMHFTVTENNLNGSLIGTMDIYDVDVLGSDNLRCSISDRNFTVNPKTCQLFANNVFDREKLDRYALTATVTDDFGMKSHSYIIVKVLDTNDNLPLFASKYYNISIHTNFLVGQYAAYVTADDPDIGTNADADYYTSFDDDTFTLDKETGGLRLNKDLKKISKRKFSFTVSVRDHSSKLKGTSSARVDLNVLPPSNKSPVLEQDNYHFSMEENNFPGYKIGQVTAKRPISNSEAFIKYSIKSGNIDGIFMIGQFGELWVTKQIDYESYTSFKLIVEADDILNSALVTNVSVVISIIDTNDNRPTFRKSDTFVMVNEGVPIGYVLYDCNAIDRDSEERGLVTYHIKNTTGHFTIHPTSGELKTNGSLDYESASHHVIYIEASDNGKPPLSSMMKLSVSVTDVNDNTPMFYNNSYVIRVKEDAQIGNSLLTVNASDSDYGKNGEFDFQLVWQDTGDPDTFQMHPNGTLYLAKLLDREKVSSYKLTALVKDFGIPSLHSKANILVVVDDVNDEAPVFQQSHYTFEVFEELPPGTYVGQVIATDADSGENGNFDYYLRDQDKFEFVTVDSYGKRVCVIKTKKKFDRETDDDSYNITVGASDHGKFGRSSKVTVQIFIKNINDHPPKFDTKLPYVSCVIEGSAANLPIITVVARDHDKIPVPLEYTLVALNETEEPSLRLFKINKINGTITTRKRLDNLKKNVYQMVVSVEEKTTNRPFINYQKVVIFVVPKLSGVLFKDQCIHISQQEQRETKMLLQGFNYHSGYEIGNYRIVKPPGSILPFSILRTTGILRLDARLNRNVKQYYQLNITAEGKKDGVFYTDSVYVNIYVIPNNMYPPQYRKNPEKYTVKESIQPGKPFKTLKLPVDRDKGMEGTCIFSIEEPIDAPIKILPMQRQIMFTEAIDREKSNEIVLKVRVHDLAEDINQRLSNTFTVAITVQDENDNPPQFISSNFSYVYEDAKKGSIVSNVVAQDPDLGMTKTTISYKIASGNEDHTFVLDGKTGALSTAKLLNIDRRRYFQLQIIAKENRDRASKIRSLESSFNINVEVIDVNNKAPKFNKSQYTAHVKEGEPVGTFVTQLFSTDGDIKDEYKEVTYELVDQNSFTGFSIDPRSGVIRTKIIHDREKKSSFQLAIIVRNVASPYGEDTCVVDITIDDINDNPPRFSTGVSEIHIMENTKPHNFYQFVVVDEDAKPNAEVIYSIMHLHGNTGVFRLDPRNGSLWVDKTLDREQREKYSFVVEATNLSPPKHKCYQNVTIIVDDENDENPVFQKKKYKIDVNESRKLNTTILQVKAKDADVGVNARIEYSIVNSTDDGVGHFGVNQETGEIYLIAPLDYEKKKSYKFQVKATGPGVNSFDKTIVVVNILDENDNPPQFSSEVYEFEAKTISMSPIGVVTATDADEDGHQKVRYSLFPRNSDFSVAPETGEIRVVNQKLIPGQYRLHVKAEDVHAIVLQNWAEVLVSVGDKSSIKFLNSSVVFSLNENPSAKYQLGRLLATSSIPGSRVRYHIMETSNPEYAFGINSKSGQLFVNNSEAVDYEKHENFFLGVLASLENAEHHSTFLHVLINLTDVNDNTPYIYPQITPHNLAETNDHPFNPMLVYQFLVEDKDKIDEKRLKLDIISGNEDGTFYIDNRHRLHVAKNVDYEKKHFYNLVVRVTDGGNPVHYADSKFYIHIKDINDNAPIFEKMLPISVSESTAVGQVLYTVKATDIDTIKTNIKYRLEELNVEPNSSMFTVHRDSGDVMLLAPLDYEKKKLYKLKISAFDGYYRTYEELQINVVDVNDHEPRFTKSVYVQNVPTTLKQGEFVIRVKANDLDQSDYGHVLYRLNPPRDAFTIKQETGEIFVNKPYKFADDTQSINLQVVAFDSYGSRESRESSARVELRVNRVKKPIPKFQRQIYNFSVTERSPSGVPVGKVKAFFTDTIHRKMSYRIVDGNIGQAFTIGVHSGLLKIKNAIDGEEHSQFTLSVVAEADTLSATCLVGVEIKDINDNPPKFEKNNYVVSIYENVTVNTNLIQLKATDADNPKAVAGNIVYSIHSGQQSMEWVEINETSGLVRTKMELDRETTPMIQLTIKATDLRGNGIHSLTSLNVTVLDVNDNSPNFDIALITEEIKVPENAAPNTLVFKANAVDLDEGENGRVSYEIMNGTGLNKFYMNHSFPGWVYTKVKLDYEEASQYNLRVLAYDHGHPRKEHSVDYEIYVTDENEYTPRFDKPSFSFDILASLEVGSVIGNVSATDEDGGEAGIIRYTIEQNEKDAFLIDQRTGVIKVKRDLRRQESSGDSDGGRQRRSTKDEPNDVEDFTFDVRADNGDNTPSISTSVKVSVNYSCVNCVIKTPVNPTQPTMKTTTTVVVLASIAVFLLLLFVLCMAYFLRKKGCCSRTKNPARFCKGKKDINLSSSVERELLNSGASSFDRLQQHFCTDHQAEKSRISSETGLLPGEGSGTARSARSVSATDKASTFSFGVYHEQGIPESEMHTLGDTLSDMTLKDFEQDSVFGYPPGKMKSEATKSLISRSTQESSLYSFSSNAHRNVFTFGPRPNSKKRIASRSDSHESLKDFMEEGGGEEAGGMDVGNLLYAKLAEVGEEEHDAIMDGVRSFHEEGPLSHGGSFSTIVGSEDDLRRHYNYNYLNTWRPRFHPMNSVFSEIGRNGGTHSSNHSVPPMPNGHLDKKHPPVNYQSYNNSKKELSGNSVVPKQSTIPETNSSRASKPKQAANEIPLQTINSGRTSMLSSVQSLPQIPQDIQSNYTSGALSPNFTPAITPLVFRSPSVSSIGTQENFPTQPKPASFEVGYSNLRRADSNVSQLSKITLSDLEISDDEV